MNGMARTLGSSIGRKTLVALTGLALLGFVVVHMLGNLQIFLGPEALNAYAAQLKSLGGLLWLARGGLLAVAVLHVGLAIKLAAENKAARPQAYAQPGRVQSTLGARSMVLTGLMILLFVLYHLAHFTWGVTDPENFSVYQSVQTPTGPLQRHDVFYMVVKGFQQPLVSGLYIAAMGLLALHLSHGVQSVAQTLGMTNPGRLQLVRRAGTGLAWLIFLGNVSMPVAIMAGIIDLPGAS